MKFKKLLINFVFLFCSTHFVFSQDAKINNFQSSFSYLNGLIKQLETNGYDIKSIRIGKEYDMTLPIEFYNVDIDTLYIRGIGIRKDYMGSFSNGELSLSKTIQQYNSNTKAKFYQDSILVSQKNATSQSIGTNKQINIWNLFLVPNAKDKFTVSRYKIAFDILEDTKIGTVGSSVNENRAPNSYDTFLIICYVKKRK
jgi:hypothetical protein